MNNLMKKSQCLKENNIKRSPRLEDVKRMSFKQGIRLQEQPVYTEEPRERCTCAKK